MEAFTEVSDSDTNEWNWHDMLFVMLNGTSFLFACFHFSLRQMSQFLFVIHMRRFQLRPFVSAVG